MKRVKVVYTRIECIEDDLNEALQDIPDLAHPRIVPPCYTGGQVMVIIEYDT